ncbi:MAG: GNAT family N-acetyltransferase [Armatimonas sp.]
MEIVIRPATPADGPAFLSLVDALADYEQLPRPTEEARTRLLTDAFEISPARFSLLLAETEETGVIGYAVTFETYSTFLAKPTLYLEDLFVHPDHRSIGAGRALFGAVRAEAKKEAAGAWSGRAWTGTSWPGSSMSAAAPPI